MKTSGSILNPYVFYLLQGKYYFGFKKKSMLVPIRIKKINKNRIIKKSCLLLAYFMSNESKYEHEVSLGFIVRCAPSRR